MSAIHDQDTKREKESIHSGHFMVSDFEADEQDDEDEVAIPIPEESVQDDLKTNKTLHNIGTQRLPIDTSLSKLFQCMSIAYRQKLTSPKWNRFRGIRLRWKDKIRLNNVIWRCWHLQFIKKENTLICQFASPLDVDIHSKPEAVVLEGKYWKRKLGAVTAEYKKWRLFFRNHGLGQPTKDEIEAFNESYLLSWNSESTEHMDMMVDEDYMGLMSDTLFSTISNQPFVFPDSREIAKAGLADFIQPSLGPLQPNLDDYMDTFEEFEDITPARLTSVSEESIHSWNTNNPANSDTLQQRGIIRINNCNNNPISSGLVENNQLPIQNTYECRPQLNHFLYNTSIDNGETLLKPNSIENSLSFTASVVSPVIGNFSISTLPQNSVNIGEKDVFKVSTGSTVPNELLDFDPINAHQTNGLLKNHPQPMVSVLQFPRIDSIQNSLCSSKCCITDNNAQLNASIVKMKHKLACNNSDSAKDSTPSASFANSAILTHLLKNSVDESFHKCRPNHTNNDKCAKKASKSKLSQSVQKRTIFPLKNQLIASRPVETASSVTKSAVVNLKSQSDSRSAKRTIYVQAEQKRRYNLQSGFDILHHIIPQVKENANVKISKAVLLQKGTEYIRQLTIDRTNLSDEIESLRQQIDLLNSSINNFQSLLPITGAPVAPKPDNKTHEMFDAYVKRKTMENWRFWIFSLFFKRLLTSFNTFVSTNCLDELYRTINLWIEQHCSLPDLRPIVVNSLRVLCIKTDILSEPEKLPDEIRALVQKENGIP